MSNNLNPKIYFPKTKTKRTGYGNRGEENKLECTM